MFLVQPPVTSSPLRYIIWSTGVLFVLFQFFLQLSSGVVIHAIASEFSLSALASGLLASSFYYIYTGMQIPVGILFDLKNTRSLLVYSALVCSLGCFLFAQSNSMWMLFVARLIIGGGASFAFVGLSHLLREHFPLNQFAFMIGFTETLGLLFTMLGIIGLGVLLTSWGWRDFLYGSALTGVFIAFLCRCFIPANKKPVNKKQASHWPQFKAILGSGSLWVTGWFVGLSFTVITVFGGMWAIPFIKTKFACSLKEASFIDSMLFLGTAISCPLFAWIIAHAPRRKPVILFSCLSTALLLLLLLFLPIQNPVTGAVLMFLIGLCCGAYMLAYTIANELAPAGTMSTCTGFINTLAILTAPLLQPLVGWILDMSSTNDIHTLMSYQWALSVVPCCLIIAACLAVMLPEEPV